MNMDTSSKENNREMLLDALNLNMNEELRATFQYICHRIAAHPTNRLLAESFKTAALDEMTHILYFSDLLTKYGGSPTFHEWPVDKSTDLKTMLAKDLQLEKEAQTRYADQIEKFKAFEDVMMVLQAVLDDESAHEETFLRYEKTFP
jgi:bacterioferritin (cytochrome b1)